MTDKPLCPFCGHELDAENYYIHCHNPHCNKTIEMSGTEELWQALIDTKKKLDKALDGLEYADKCLTGGTVGWKTEIRKIIEQIKDKEQQ